MPECRHSVQLDSDQFGELGRDVSHWHFCCVQSVSRSEHRTDFPDSFICRAMHDGNKLISRQEHREFLVRYARCWQTLQKRRSHQDDPNPRLRQTLIDGAEKWLSEPDIILAEPDRDAARHEQIVQLLGSPLPIVPRMAKKYLPKVWQRRTLLDSFTNWRKGANFLRRVKLR